MHASISTLSTHAFFQLQHTKGCPLLGLRSGGNITELTTHGGALVTPASYMLSACSVRAGAMRLQQIGARTG
jgi:hypothetical protein